MPFGRFGVDAMKRDLKRLLDEYQFDALWVRGPAAHNASMRYFTGEAHLTHAELFLAKGKDPVIFCGPMEREEAAGTGIETRDLSQYNLRELIQESEGDVVLAQARMLKEILEDLGLTESRLALYGKVELGSAWGVLSRLESLLPDLALIGEGRNSLLLQARATKDQPKIERIRKMGQVTTAVVRKTAGYLQSRPVDEDQVLLNDSGQPLTVQEMKTRINLWLAEKGVENPEGVIFAIGRDAGIPHSAGTPEDVLRLGRTIVFDIFPCEKGGGYFYDFTRTWCLGYASEPEKELYQDVHEVYDLVMKKLEEGIAARELQKYTCSLFEARGHQTVESDPQIKQGYVHSLGHGLGLNVHERPWFGRGATEKDRLSAGTVVTIEPGLYYPEREMGCRLENTVWMRPDGRAEVLVDYPLDLVLEMDHWSPTDQP